MSDDEFRVEVDLDRPKVKNTADVQRIRLQKLMDKHAKVSMFFLRANNTNH